MNSLVATDKTTITYNNTNYNDNNNSNNNQY